MTHDEFNKLIKPDRVNSDFYHVIIEPFYNYMQEPPVNSHADFIMFYRTNEIAFREQWRRFEQFASYKMVR